MKYEYWWHDGGHGFILADDENGHKFDEERKVHVFYMNGFAFYEMPLWMVERIEEVKVKTEKEVQK